MEVVAAPSSGAPFHDHDVREWSRIDSITGALERARLETDHWSANTINSSHKYGKVVDSRARSDADGALHQSARRQLEVFSSEVPGGRLQVVKTHTVSTSKWSSSGSSKDFENLQLSLNPLDLTSQKSKASVGRSVARRPPTRQRPKENLQPTVDLKDPLRNAHITAATNLHRVSRLCHQIHESAVRQAFGRRSPRPTISDRESGDGGVEIYEIESASSEHNNSNNRISVNGHTNLVRTKSSSSDDISLLPEKDTNGNKSIEDLEDLEQLQTWRRTSKIRRSLQFPKQSKQTATSKPVDLPENVGSVRKIREELEKGRRLNTALRNNSVDLDALDQILQSISSSASDRTSEDQELDSPKKQKRNSFVTVESIQEIKGRLRKTSSPTNDIYKVNGKDDDPDDGIVTEETTPVTGNEMPLVENSRVRSYVYGMEALLNKKPGIGTGSLESRVKLLPNNKNEDWYNRRKSYGFEKVHNHNDSQNSILLKNKNVVESSTDSGICRSIEIVVPIKKNGYKENECSSDEHNDFEQKYKEFDHNNKLHLGQVKRIAKSFNHEESISPTNKNENWKKGDTDWSNSPTELKSTTITIPISKNNNIVDLPWNDTDREQLKDAKRHSIAVDESKYVTRNTDNNFRRISLALNDQIRHDDDENNMRKTKKVEFCKTEVHFAAESGKVNIVATDDKPPPTQNFRRRRRNSGPSIEDFNKNGLPLLHFGDTTYEKPLFINSEDSPTDSVYENLQSRIPSNYSLVTVNSNSSVNAEISEEEKKELTDSEIKGILKNKPIKPKPYHLGETAPFMENISDEEGKWGVRLRHVDKPEVPIWKSTVTVHNYNFMNQGKENEPEFQKLLKNLRPTRKTDYGSDSDTKFFDGNINTNINSTNSRTSSWPAPEKIETSKEVKGMEIKGYSTKICLREGEATVVENEGYDKEKQSIRPRIENLRKDSKHLLNKSLVVRIGKEDSALNHTLCSKMSTTEDTNNTTTTTKITIDLSPSPPAKSEKTFSYAKYQRSQPSSFKSTSLILNTIHNNSNNGYIHKTAETKDSIPKELEALKKLYEDVQSDSDADKEVQYLLSRVTRNSNAENDNSSVLSGSWSKMKTYRNMNSVKEATTTRLGAKIEKDSPERLRQPETSPLITRIQGVPKKQSSNVNLIRSNVSPNPLRRTPIGRPDLRPCEQLSSPSIVNRSKNIDVTIITEDTSIGGFNKNIDSKKILTKSSDGIVLRTPKKSEMTYFGVNVSPKPVKKISQAVIRKENKLSEKPDLILYHKKSPSPIRRSQKSPSPIRKFQKSPSPTRRTQKSPSPTRNGRKSPVKLSEPIYENIKNKYGREFDSSILEELTKAADQILQAVNGYTDEEMQNRYVADPGYQSGVAEDLGVDQSTMSRTVKYMMDRTVSQANNWITCPTNDVLITQAKTLWQSKYQFPTAIGVIGCTHVGIQKPKVYGDEYSNRKGKASMNVQATCDANEIFTSVDVSWPGSVHDGRIWRNSEIRQILSIIENTILIADSGYGIERYLMTPYENPQDGAETQYNVLLKKERVIIERCLGQLKRRFPILLYVCRKKLENIPKLVVACVILHNVAKMLGDRNFEDDVVPAEDAIVHEEVDDVENDRAHRQLGQRIRNNLTKLSSDEEDDSKKNKLETILETKSMHQKSSTPRPKLSNAKTKLKPTSPTSSVESLGRKKTTPEPKMKPCYERHRRRTERIEKIEKTDQHPTKAANTKARRLQRASSREALLRSNGSSSEDLPAKVEPPRKPRLVKKTKAVQLTISNGVEFKKHSVNNIGRRKEENVSKSGEERILNSLPEIRHKTAVSTIRSTSEKTARDRMKHKTEDVKRRAQQKKDPSKVINSSSRSEKEKSSKQSTPLHKETVTHRISTAYVPVCRNRSRNMHARQQDTDCPCLCS